MLRRRAPDSTAKAGPSDQRVDSPPDNRGKAKAKQDLPEDLEDLNMSDDASKYEDDKDDTGSSKFHSASSIRICQCMLTELLTHKKDRSAQRRLLQRSVQKLPTRLTPLLLNFPLRRKGSKGDPSTYC